MSSTQSTSYATSVANQVSTKPFGKSDDKPFGKSDDKPFGKSDDKPFGKPFGKSDDKPNGFNRDIASRNTSAAHVSRPTDRQIQEKCRKEGTCFPIILGEVLKDGVRRNNGLEVNHKKNYTVRTGKSQGNFTILSDVKRYKGFNDLSYALFTMHCATKNLNYELTNDLIRYIVEHFGLTEREVVEARYGINKDNLLGINLFNCAVASLAVDCFRLALCYGTDPNQVNSYGENAEGMIQWAEKHLNKHKPGTASMHAVRREQCLDFIKEAREFDEIKRLRSLDAQPNMFDTATEETERNLTATAVERTPKKAKKEKSVPDIDEDGFSTTTTAVKKATKLVSNKKTIGSSSAFSALMDDEEDEKDDKNARKAAKKAKKLEKAEKATKKARKDAKSEKSNDETPDINFMTPNESSIRSSSPHPVVRKKKAKTVSKESMTSAFSALSFDESDSSDKSDKSNDETLVNAMTPDITTKSIPDAPKQRRSLRPHGKILDCNLDKELLSSSVTIPDDSNSDSSEPPPLISDSEDSEDDAFITPVKKTPVVIQESLAKTKRPSSAKPDQSNRVSFADKLKAVSNETEIPVIRPVKTKEPGVPRMTLKQKKKMKKEKAKAELKSSTSSEQKYELDTKSDKSDKSDKIYQNDEEGQQYMDDVIAHIYVINDEDAALILPYVEQIRLTMDPSLLEEFNELFSTIM